MLTSRDSEIDHVNGLELGADDYISKPIRFHELIARIKAVLRRADSNQLSSSKVSFRGLVMDLSSRKVTVNDQDLELSFKEFKILRLLAGRPGRVFTRAEILDAVWSEEASGKLAQWMSISAIEEIGQSPLLIETVRNVGYRLPMSL